MKPIKIYIHLFEKGPWESFLEEKVSLMKTAGLWQRASEVIYCAHGNESAFKKLDGRVVLHNSVAPFNEQYTNRTIKQEVDLSTESFYLLRFHLKGINWIGHPDQQRVKEYADLLNYHNIERWQAAVEKLDQGYDLAGVNWVKNPWPHFIGNIWWASSDYIRQLPLLKAPHEVNFRQQIPGSHSWAIHDAESWIGLGAACAWDLYRNTDQIGLHPDIN